MHHYFERRGYANYLLLGNGDIRSIYVVYLVHVCYIFGYDVPTCGSRVLFVYIVYVSLLFLFLMLMIIPCLEK